MSLGHGKRWNHRRGDGKNAMRADVVYKYILRCFRKYIVNLFEAKGLEVRNHNLVYSTKFVSKIREASLIIVKQLISWSQNAHFFKTLSIVDCANLFTALLLPPNRKISGDLALYKFCHSYKKIVRSFSMNQMVMLLWLPAFSHMLMLFLKDGHVNEIMRANDVTVNSMKSYNCVKWRLLKIVEESDSPLHVISK